MPWFPRLLILALLASLCGAAHAQNADVRAQIEVVHPDNRRASQHDASSSVVVWLTPVVTGDAVPIPHPSPGHFRMAQKNKAFQPHLLVVPLGSTVAFPNLDPFFHNVFSQFNGKRFDLGLYEAGSTKDVRFNHEGISYIFCNIHPEMSAVIITLDTPWYASAAGSRAITLHDVPAGTYSLHVWAEGADARQLESLMRTVRINPEQNDLGVIRITVGEESPAHKNKFGQNYRPDPDSAYPR